MIALPHFQIIESPFIPSEFNYATIRNEFLKYVNRFFDYNSVSLNDINRGPVIIRKPSENLIIFNNPKEDAHTWHQDGFNSVSDTNGWLFLWSNKNSTLLKDVILGEVIKIPNSNLVLFNNERFKHKTDRSSEYNDRWFARLMFRKL